MTSCKANVHEFFTSQHINIVYTLKIRMCIQRYINVVYISNLLSNISQHKFASN